MSAAQVSDRRIFPIYCEDLFSDEALLDPFRHWRAIRELAPVVRLRAPHVLVLTRFRDVQRALQSPDKLISGKGVGFNDFINQPTPEPGVLTSDGDRHRRMRMPLMKYLWPAPLKSFQPELARLIDEKVATLVDTGTFDAVAELAHHLPVEAISKLVGLPEQDRAKMLRWAAASFNVVGVIERDGAIIPELADDLASATEVRDYLLALDPAILRPGSWAADLFEQVRAGGMTLGDARSSLRAFVLPSLDTTIAAAGNLLHNLGSHPDQYAQVRRNPAYIQSAVYESMRFSPVARWFSRVAAVDYEADDVFIPAGERVMVIFGAANRDPAKYPNPDVFDVTRNPSDQLGWGAGPHVCAGKHLARIEMEVLLEAIVKRVGRIEIDEPKRNLNRGLWGLRSLPMRLCSE